MQKIRNKYTNKNLTNSIHMPMICKNMFFTNRKNVFRKVLYNTN